jgi:hypothetical protein
MAIQQRGVEVLVKTFPKIILAIIIIFFLSCFSPSAKLVLKGEVCGYEYNGSLWITFQVENVGRGSAIDGTALITVIDTKTDKSLDDFEKSIGDFLPGEMRDVDIPLPDKFEWGDDIRISLRFSWRNK